MPIKKKRRTRRPISRKAYFVFFLIFAAILVVAHAAFLTLPFYWDEAGQFVPASLDLYRSGFFIPRSVTPNAHPPGLMAYLAAVWSITGYSILATRVAMLFLGAVAVLAAFLLAIKLSAEIKGTPAFAVVLLLLVTPLFYSQSMLAQLDMPAMLLTTIALLLFLEDRIIASALVSVALVMVKETGVVTPLLFAIWLAAERRIVQAAAFLVAPLALGLWFLALHHQTGSWFGSAQFTQYNVESMQHPLGFGLAFAKRLYHLFWEDLRFIGALAILYALMQDGVYSTRGWRLAWTLVALHIVMFTLIGGAMLERYLLPVLPVVYIGMVAALYCMPNPWRLIGTIGLIAGAVIGNIWNPPYPYPFREQSGLYTVREAAPGRGRISGAKLPGDRSRHSMAPFGRTFQARAGLCQDCGPQDTRDPRLQRVLHINAGQPTGRDFRSVFETMGSPRQSDAQ